MEWYAKSVEDLTASLETDTKQRLSNGVAQARLAEHGANELVEELRIFIKTLLNFW